MHAALVFLIFVVAVLSSMLGLGGGVLYTPLQDWVGIEFHQAAANSLFLIVVVSLSATVVFRKAKKVDWPLIAVLESATIVGGYFGGRFAASFSVSELRLLFAAVAVVAGTLMVRTAGGTPSSDDSKVAGQRGNAKPQQRGPARWFCWEWCSWERCVGDQAYRVNLGIGLPLSFAVGLISCMVGVGGGILKIPMMVLLLGVPLDIAIGSSALMIGLTAAAGLLGHVQSGQLQRGDWDWRLSIVLAVAVLVGSQIGSRISIRMNKRELKRGFGWFLWCVAAVMLASIFR